VAASSRRSPGIESWRLGRSDSQIATARKLTVSTKPIGADFDLPPLHGYEFPASLPKMPLPINQNIRRQQCVGPWRGQDCIPDSPPPHHQHPKRTPATIPRDPLAAMQQSEYHGRSQQGKPGGALKRDRLKSAEIKRRIR